MAGRAIPLAYRNAATKSRSGALANQTAHFPLQLFRRGIQHRTSRVNYNIPPAVDFRQPQSQQLAKPPSGPISLHRLAKSPRHGKSNPRPFALRAIRTQAKRGKKRRGKPDSLPVDPAEVTGSKDSGASGEPKTCRRTSRGASNPHCPVRRTALSSLTVSLCRPLARRRDSTARPSFVFMRSRKPCVLARLRLFG